MTVAASGIGAGRPGRPSPADSTKGDRTRRRLLDAAAAELAQLGPAGVSLAGIAAAAGLKTGSIYFHFASKDELIATVLAEGLRETLRLLDEALSAVPDTTDARARLRAAIRAHLVALHELDDYATIVLARGIADDLPAAAEFRALRKRYGSRWAELIADAQRAGVLRGGDDPRDVRDLVFGAMNSALSRREWSPEAQAGALTRLLGLDGPDA
jgi:TetR/AcrR family transcriptional regulator, cholesterol catabolism regulator